MTVRAMLAVGALVFASSCSIKEDRLECPTFLTLDFSGVESSRMKDEGFDCLEVYLTDGNGFSVSESWVLDGFVGEYSVPVPNSGVDLMVICRKGGSCSAETGLTIEEGEECPELYMSAEHYVPVYGEERYYVALHRNYCELFVCFKTMFDVPARPFRVKVVGDVDGYLPGGTPREGAFSYFSAPSFEGLCRARIPRQVDGSLMLEVDFLDSNDVRTFPVGEYILESGYDWNAADLEDIRVEMDFSRTGVTFTLSQWKKTLSFDITF